MEESGEVTGEPCYDCGTRYSADFLYWVYGLGGFCGECFEKHFINGEFVLCNYCYVYYTEDNIYITEEYESPICKYCYDKNSSGAEEEKVLCVECKCEVPMSQVNWTEDGYYCYTCYAGYINGGARVCSCGLQGTQIVDGMWYCDFCYSAIFGGAGYPDTPEVSEKEEIIEEVASATC